MCDYGQSGVLDETEAASQSAFSSDFELLFKEINYSYHVKICGFEITRHVLTLHMACNTLGNLATYVRSRPQDDWLPPHPPKLTQPQ